MNTHIRNRRLARAGFTLVEAIVIIVILGIIAAVIAPRVFQNIGSAKSGVAASNAAALATSVNNLYADAGELREDWTIRALLETPSGMDEDEYNGPYVQNEEALLDPWGNEFELVIPGEKNTDFDIVSYGRDGAPGGEGEDKDIVKP